MSEVENKQQEEQTQKKNNQNRERKENNRKGEKKDGEKKHKGEKKQRESPYDWDKTKVTLETPIPTVPKKSEQVHKPDESKMEKKREELQKKIDELFQQKRTFIENLVLQQKKSKDTKVQGSEALRNTLKDQQAKKKDLEEKFDKIKVDFEGKKSQIDKLYDESQKIRRKMKNCEAKDKLEEMIADRREQLDHAILNNQQEIKLLKEIDHLERALPLASKLAPIEEQIKELNTSKKELGTQMHQALTVLKQAREDVRSTYNDLDELKKMSEKSRESVEPLIQQKKEELNDKITELRTQQKKVFSDYKDQQRKYYDEQELIRYADWIKKRQEKLKRDARIKKREEEKLQRQQEEEEEEKARQAKLDAINPYQKDIDTCEQLINFCKVEIQKNQVVSQEQQQTQSRIQVEESVLQKEKITQIKNKREQEDDFFSGTKNKKKQKKQFKKEETKPQTITLTFQDLADFSQVKVTAPRNVEDLAKTLEILQEKKTYYENLPKPEKKENEEVQETQAKQSVNVDDQEDYPEL